MSRILKNMFNHSSLRMSQNVVQKASIVTSPPKKKKTLGQYAVSIKTQIRKI